MKKLFVLLLAIIACTAVQAAVETGKTYRIVPAGNTSKSLFVRNSSLGANSAVVIWTETDRPAQQWTAAAGTAEGTYSFRNVYTGRYLSTSGSQLVQVAGARQWTLEPVEDAEDTYYLKLGENYLNASAYTDGTQPTTTATPQKWILAETEAQTELTETIRRRMLNGFLLQFMQDKGSGRRTFANGGWSESEMQEIILDAYEATGDPAILGIFEASYDLLKYHVGNYWNGGTQVGGYGWFGYSFNDDVMWEIIAAARTGKRVYLDDAKRNFDIIWNRAYLGYVGLLRWAEQDGDRNGANSCVNGPAEVAACYIAAGLGDESYFEKAKELYTNQRKYLYEPNTGRVYDNVVFDPATLSIVKYSNWASTYNQGTMLGAAVLLYRHYGDEMYKNDAAKIIEFSRNNLCNSDGVISACRDVGNNDLQGFKGILMRYVGLYANEFDDATTKEWLIRNAMHAYCNQNSREFGTTDWLTKANEDLMAGEINYGNRPFGASTSLGAAFGPRLNDLYVDTGESTTLEAEDGTLSGNAEILTDPNTGQKFVGNLDNGTGYIRLTYPSAQQSDYRIEVYYVTAQNRDLQITAGTKRITVSCPSVGTWDDLSKEGKVSAIVNMRAGNINIMLTNPNGASPNIDKIVITPVTTTKENNTLTADKAERVGDSKMIFNYRADKAGRYQARVSYKTDANRSMYISVNGSERKSQSFNNTNGYVNLRPLFVTLREGDNTIELGNATTTMPEVTQVELVYLSPVSNSLEAEQARSTGSPNIQKDDRSSGGEYIANLGNGAGNYITFYYDADEAGDYDLTIYYYSASDRNMHYQINGGTKVRRTFGSTGSWNGSRPVGTKTIRVQLQVGQNSISLGNETAAAPNVDKIELAKVPVDSAVGGISANVTGDAADRWYDLRGMRVDPTADMPAGIYIQNGRKVVRR